ncbi:uncharacterized protein LOC133197661 [Saccostrea echinata]|uniref:uncharacterized protein LOC133197661 n=1 Tax=Saccostrea echinata TaxID=191078 RepID=UPI002A7EC29F|nr:uncharacterized protein LOC133197661 [Saccostrea echinata]
MESIKVIFIMVITHQNYFSESANVKCKPGLEHLNKGVCEPCLCPKGHGLNISMVSVDKLAGNASCSPCIPCTPGQFSSLQTKFLCEKCSMPCNMQNRITIQHCGSENDYVCGECMTGYMKATDKVCRSMDSHGREIRRQLKDDDHTVYFVLAGITIPLWMVCICYCIFRNKIGSWRQKPKTDCKQPDACKINMIHIINHNIKDDPFDPKIDEKTLIEHPEP